MADTPDVAGQEKLLNRRSSLSAVLLGAVVLLIGAGSQLCSSEGKPRPDESEQARECWADSPLTGVASADTQTTHPHQAGGYQKNRTYN